MFKPIASSKGRYRLWMDLLIHWERNIYARAHFFLVGHAFLLAAFFQSFVSARTRVSLLLAVAGVGLSLILLYVGLREWYVQNLASNKLEALAREIPELEPLLEIRSARRNLPLLSESVIVIVAVGLPLLLLVLWSVLTLGAWRKFCGKTPATPRWVTNYWLSVLLFIVGLTILLWPVVIRRIESAFRAMWTLEADPTGWRTNLVAFLTGTSRQDADPRVYTWLCLGVLLILGAFFFWWIFPLPC